LVAAAKRDALIPVTTEKDLARLHVGGELPAWAQGIEAFPVKLEFDSALKLRRFVSDRLLRARDAKFRKR
jgi:tetraacyldisaccharide 4'-kinase